jgi:proteic killer suppression protein
VLAARLARSLIRPQAEGIDRAGENRLDKRNPLGYISLMIKSFKHKGLERFFYTGSKKGIRPEHTKKLARILDRLNAAKEIKDMNYPGSFLHRLSGNREGQYSVRVSGNWRMFFEFKDGDAFVVDYADYH